MQVVDDDGNAVLVLSDVEAGASYSCTVINEIAENSTSCQVRVVGEEGDTEQQDEDVIR